MFLVGSVCSEGVFSFDSPSMCNPNEDPTVCGLKIERNNLADEDAIFRGQVERGKLRTETLAQWWKEYLMGLGRKDKAKAEYWKAYTQFIPDMKELNHHITSVCRTPIANQSVLSLCLWWKRNR